MLPRIFQAHHSADAVDDNASVVDSPLPLVRSRSPRSMKDTIEIAPLGHLEWSCHAGDTCTRARARSTGRGSRGTAAWIEIHRSAVANGKRPPAWPRATTETRRVTLPEIRPRFCASRRMREGRNSRNNRERVPLWSATKGVRGRSSRR